MDHSITKAQNPPMAKLLNHGNPLETFHPPLGFLLITQKLQTWVFGKDLTSLVFPVANLP
jgi:hypothetical protein